MIVTLMAWAVVVADLAIGGRPDPPTLRAAVTVLDGVAMFACIGLVIGYQSRSDHKSFLIWASIALALMANTFTRPSSRCWPL